MREKPSTVGDVLKRARAPYTHMSEEDCELFYPTMNKLLIYANERLGVVPADKLKERPEGPHMLYEHGGQIAEELWKNRSLVEDFARDNPAGLSRDVLDCVRPWRHALRDMFVCVDADADRTILMNQDRLFVVGAMQDPADAHVHHIPSLMLLTLLPFKGGIITDGKTIHLSPKPKPEAVPAIAQQMANLCARPLVRTARQLLSYTRTIPDSENRVTPRFQREVDKAFEHELLA